MSNQSRSGSSYGSHKRRNFHGGSVRRNWEDYPLTGMAKGDEAARVRLRRESENRLFFVVR